MEKKIAVIFGDGIGPEVTRQSIKVLNAIASKYSSQFPVLRMVLWAL